jgi:hypothetical protein
MAKSSLGKTKDLMKGILAETIDDLTATAKKSSKSLLTAILEQGSENVDELLDVCGGKLKEKVKTHGKDKQEESQ